jgi:protein-tyrosine-phosphatase
MPSVLFVCTANICRSPMASVLFRSKVASRADAASWRIESAGVWGMDGNAAAQKAQLVMRSMGLDLGKHLSQALNRGLLHQFNLILTMERGHKEGLSAEFPELASRIYMLSEMVNRNYDIHDPISGSLPDYQDTAREIDQILNQGMDKITQLAQMDRA